MEVEQQTQPTDPTAGLPPGSKVVWDSNAASPGSLEAVTAPTPPPSEQPKPFMRRLSEALVNQNQATKDQPGSVYVPPAFQQWMTTPKVDTGYPMLDEFTKPITALILAGGGPAVLKAGLSGGLPAAVGEAWGQTGQVIRYEVLAGLLEKFHIPGARAIAAVVASKSPAGTAAPKTTAPPPIRWPEGAPEPTPVAAPPIRWPAAEPVPTQSVTPPPPIRYPVAEPVPTQSVTPPPPIRYPATEPVPTRPVTPPPPIRYPATTAAPAPVAPPPIRMPQETPAPVASPTPPPPIRFQPAPAQTPAPRPVAPPPIRWPDTISEFTPTSSAPAAEPAPVATPPKGASQDAAVKVLTGKGMAASNAARTVQTWVRNGIPNLVKYAKEWADEHLD